MEDFVPRITISCNYITSWRFMIHWTGMWRSSYDEQYYNIYFILDSAVEPTYKNMGSY